MCTMGRFRSLISSIVTGIIIAAGYGMQPAHAQGTAITIDNIQVRLFLEISGTLSKNVAPPAAPALWNTFIGEGDAGEPANDFLVLVFLSGPADKFVKQPLIVSVVRGGEKKPIGKRRIETLLFGPEGKLTKPVFVTDATCGTVRITASTGSIRKSTNVDFRCGE
jgi:hypothetical protein